MRRVLAKVPPAVALVVAVALAVAACATEPRSTFGAPGGPAGSLTDATEAQVIAALGAVGLQAAEAQTPYLPPEAALFANAPRTVLQATLPDDPTGGFLVIYALQSPEAAAAAAADQAQYIASNRGGIFSFAGRYVIRLVGSNVVFFMWLPDSATDPRTVKIEEALLSVGTEVPIAR